MHALTKSRKRRYTIRIARATDFLHPIEDALPAVRCAGNSVPMLLPALLGGFLPGAALAPAKEGLAGIRPFLLFLPRRPLPVGAVADGPIVLLARPFSARSMSTVR